MKDTGQSREAARRGVADYKGSMRACEDSVGDSCSPFKGGERQESRRQSLAVPGLSKTLFILKHDDC